METRIQAIHFDMTEKLKDFVDLKIEKLQKLQNDIVSVDVYLKVTKPETSSNKEAEIKVSAPNSEYFAAKVCDTFEESVDVCIDAIEKQIKKTKEKLRAK